MHSVEIGIPSVITILIVAVIVGAFLVSNRFSGVIVHEEHCHEYN